MEAEKILTADILDIIFDGRNKDYGAFDLRKTYQTRLLAALIVTAGLAAVSYFSYMAMMRSDTHPQTTFVVDDRVLEDVNISEKDKIQPPPVQKLVPPNFAVTKFATIKIIPDEKVNENDRPPTVDELIESKISVVTQSGVADDNITAPPVNTTGKGIVEVAKTDNTSVDSVFTKVEIESYYPGGAGAWLRYLYKMFEYPQKAQDDEIQGTVMVQFIVDKEGNVSNVQAVSGPVSGGLREEAERVIKKSGKWEPAIQNGRKVTSYKNQPITFRLTDQ